MLAVALALILFFAYLPVAGFSPVSLLTLVAVGFVGIQLVAQPVQRSFARVLQPVVFFFTLFFLSLAISFSLNSNMAGLEWRYLIDWLLAFIWLPIMFITIRLSNGAVLDLTRKTAIVLSLLLAVSIVAIIAVVGDLFFLRSEVEIAILSSTLIGTPNISARTSLGLLVLIQLFLWNAPFGSYGTRLLKLTRLALLVVLLASLSRAGLAALLLLFVLLNFRKDGSDAFASVGRTVATVVVLVVVAGSVVLVSETARSRVDQALNIATNVQEGTAKGARAKTWLASSQIVRENPYLGIGVEKTRKKLAEYGSIKTRISTNGRTEKIVVAVHGGFLEIMVYGGVFSLLCFAFFYIGLMGWSVSLALSGQSAFNRNAGALAAIYLTLLLPLNIAAGNLREPFTWMIIGTLLACACHDPQTNRPGKPQNTSALRGQ